MEKVSTPTLYVLPCTLGDSAPMEVLPLTIRKTIEPLTHFIVENEKEAQTVHQTSYSSKATRRVGALSAQ